MTTVNKSEEEWRAILSPQQVCECVNSEGIDADGEIAGCSSRSLGRRERSGRERGNMISTTSRECTLVLGVGRPCTRAIPSSR